MPCFGYLIMITCYKCSRPRLCILSVMAKLEAALKRVCIQDEVDEVGLQMVGTHFCCKLFHFIRFTYINNVHLLLHETKTRWCIIVLLLVLLLVLFQFSQLIFCCLKVLLRQRWSHYLYIMDHLYTVIARVWPTWGETNIGLFIDFVRNPTTVDISRIMASLALSTELSFKRQLVATKHGNVNQSIFLHENIIEHISCKVKEPTNCHSQILVGFVS